MGLDVGHYLAEFVERLGCLRIQADVFVHVQFADLFQLLDDDGFAFGLAHQSQHFGMAVFPVNDNLSVFVVGSGIVLLLDSFCRRSTTGQVASMISMWFFRASS